MARHVASGARKRARDHGPAEVDLWDILTFGALGPALRTVGIRGPEELKVFSPLMCFLTMKAVQVAPSMGGAIDRMRTLRVRAHEWIESEYGNDYQAFRLDWLVARMGIALQARLLVEQVLWDKGKPWSQLCSGFRPG